MTLEESLPQMEAELARLDDRRTKLVNVIVALRNYLGIEAVRLGDRVSPPRAATPRSPRASVVDGRRAILNFLGTHPASKIGDIVAGTEYTKATVYRRLMELLDEKRIEMTGRGKGRHYGLSKEEL